ncbi:MAG TPA: TetR/AcrR family transcriptional regulator [Rhizomicrobium sp.]|jgi:AcrR family transcriptional regulator|nr:TetR/AcrR family transcriptional regulator [Rhizomicrobium sp.]
MKKTQRKRDPEDTREKLVAAAEDEFNANGFHGTDTNRIAKKAGYAPQTFYRHFADKTDIFLAVYERWWKGEVAALENVLRKRRGKDGAMAAARVVIGFHTRWRGFRRSLRHLAVTDSRVRVARAAARWAQLAPLKEAGTRRGDAELIASLLTAERLCDAAAEGEFTDMGLSRAEATMIVASAMAALTARD